MARLHPRYVEGFVPVVAALLGIGVAWACVGERRAAYRRARLVALVVALVASVYYVERLLYGRTGVWWVTLAAAVGALALTAIARVGPRRDGRRAGWLAGATIMLTLVTVGALPLSADVASIDGGVTDAGYVGALPREEQRLVSSYLRSHQGSARYDFAAESATQIGSLIVQEARPVLILTTYDARVFTTLPELQRTIARGEVRYAFLNTFCGKHISPINAACSRPARWIRAHGTDISRQAGLGRGGVLWLLPEPSREPNHVPDEAPDLRRCRRRAPSGQIALDTEFMGEGRYRTLLCLSRSRSRRVPDGRAHRAPRPPRGGSRRRAARRPARGPRRAGGPARRPPGRRAGAPAVRLEVQNVFDTQVAAGFAGMRRRLL